MCLGSVCEPGVAELVRSLSLLPKISTCSADPGGPGWGPRTKSLSFPGSLEEGRSQVSLGTQREGVFRPLKGTRVPSGGSRRLPADVVGGPTSSGGSCRDPFSCSVLFRRAEAPAPSLQSAPVGAAVCRVPRRPAPICSRGFPAHSQPHSGAWWPGVQSWLRSFQIGHRRQLRFAGWQTLVSLQL